MNVMESAVWEMGRTENGAATYRSSGSDCLDLFASIGGMRHADQARIKAAFLRAYTEDPDTALKLLFFARDVRGGLGERRSFRIILGWLAENGAGAVRKNIEYIPEYGRWDDLLSLLGTPCERDAISLIRRQLAADLSADGEGKGVSLLAKWLPSPGASSERTRAYAACIARALGLRESEYRRILSRLRRRIDILENRLREGDYSFDYEAIPSRAALRYRAAFCRHDGERYAAYLARVTKGEAHLHADALAPYELIAPYLSNEDGMGALTGLSESEEQALNATWASLPDWGGEDTLAVVDTSGSMYFEGSPLPAAVALSLGLYFAERCRGPFQGCMLTFSKNPTLIRLKGETFVDRLRYAVSLSEVADTNLEAVFSLLLSVARHSGGEALPRRIVILSDMEFNACTGGADTTNFESASRRFCEAGLTLPEVVFWNVASRHRNQPVRQNQAGVTLVSGCSPTLWKSVAAGATDPYSFMREVLGSERYRAITA